MASKRFHPMLLPALLAVLATGCDARNETAGAESAAARARDAAAGASSPASTADLAGATSPSGTDAAGDTDARGDRTELTDDLLQAYARGLEKEAEILRRPGRTLPSHMRVQMSALYPSEESDEVLEAAGLTAAQFMAIGDAVDPVLDMLTFQGKLEPRRSLDLAEADEETRRRFAADPYDQLPAESAAALRRNFDAVARPWSAIVGQVAQFD